MGPEHFQDRLQRDWCFDDRPTIRIEVGPKSITEIIGSIVV